MRNPLLTLMQNNSSYGMSDLKGKFFDSDDNIKDYIDEVPLRKRKAEDLDKGNENQAKKGKLIQLEHDESYVRYYITGNSGISKTYFRRLMLIELLKQGKQVLIDYMGFTALIDLKDSNNFLIELENEYEFRKFVQQKHVWCIIDGVSPKVNHDFDRGKIILVSSPKKEIIGGFMKHQRCKQFNMPTWEELEVNEYCNYLSKPLVSVKEKFRLCSGIVRLIFDHKITLEDLKDNIASVVTSVNSNILSYQSQIMKEMGSLCRQLFEMLCHVILRSSKDFLVCELLNVRVKTKNFRILEEEFYDKVPEINGNENCYYRLYSKTSKSVDSYIHSNQLLQITVAKKHEIKQKRIKNLKSILNKSNEIYLYFAVSKDNFDSFTKKQNYLEKKKKAVDVKD
ncbi:13333_t:CDS:2 [Funneliformis caledonium]|uniref:13333_t:CDS:1 n=1 Tax=Funneliformis caledonium TaxID=1117310 RepID=A0A9N8VL02_9GLOM|nr:13333_t:CDS:2 [Funneliformis caledonium]